MEILIAVALGWFISISSVIVGGYIGYRSKRGGYEPFINIKRPDDKPFNLVDTNDEAFGYTAEEIPPPMPDAIRAMNERFRQQAEKDLGVTNAA
jgi:hypothetical protein